MKLYSSFLLFIKIVLLNLLVSSPNVMAQKDSDGLSYYSQLAIQPKDANDIANAYKYFKVNADISLIKKDTLRAIYCLYNIASIEYKNGFYYDSENAAVQALSLIERIGQSPYTLHLRKSIYNHLGIMYKERGAPDKAIELYDKCFNYVSTAKDSATLYNNISNVYRSIGEDEEAKKELIKANSLLPRIKDTLTVALIDDNFGDLKSELKENNALNLMLKALRLRESVEAPSKIYTSYKHLAKHYYRNDSRNNTKEYALKAYVIANELRSPIYRLDAMELLLDLGNYEFVFDYKKLKDSLSVAEKQSLNKFALMKYDFSEYKRQALESQLEKEQQESRAIIAIIIASSIILLSFSLYFILKSRHKKEKLQQVYDTETRISKKVHDEIANNIYHVMTKLQGNYNIKEEFIDDIEKIYNKTRDISKEHTVLEFQDNFEVILNDLIISYSDSYTNVFAKDLFKVSWNPIPKIKKITIYKILQELLINMKKHSNATLVVLTFNIVSKKIEINYSDNGRGCNLKKSNGLQNVETRIDSINGTIIFESEANKGFKVKFTV